VAQIELLQPTEKIKDSYGKINNSLTNLNNESTSHIAKKVTDSGGAHGLVIESGTFTPFIFGSTTPGSNTYDIRNAYYLKIGNRVFFDIYMHVTKDPNMAGNVNIGGLPFTPKNDQNRRVSVSIGRLDHLSYGQAKQITALIFPNQPSINLYKVMDGGAIQSVVASDFTLLFIGISGNYEV